MATAVSSRSTAPRSRIRRRIALWIVLALCLIGALVVLGSAPPVLGARADLVRAEAAVREARRHVGAGDLEAAIASFGDAREAFDSARGRMERLPVRVAAWIPFVGNNVDVVAGLARAGSVAADGGRALAEGIARLPGGLGALAPTDGAFPTDAFADLTGPVSTASDRADEAMEILNGTPGSFLFGPVGEARWQALDELGGAARALRASEGLVAAMPRFLGAEGTRRYLVASENPAELRGTGGLWGAYAVLTLRDGEPRFSEVQAIQDLPTVATDAVPPPSPDYRENYAQFGGAGSWHNLNMTPDLPTAARASLGAWEEGTGTAYDGLIVADPFALEALMEVTGPVALPGTEVELAASNVVAFTTNEAYTVFEDTRRRKEVLGDVAIEVLRRFLEQGGRGIERARTLADVVTAGHLRLYSTDPDFQAALALAELDGAMPDGATEGSSGDVLLVDVNNAGANKIDFYAEREVSYDVSLGGEGESIARTTVTISNEAPTRGQPTYVIGPAPPLVDEQDAGDQVSITRVWCHEPCTFEDAGVDGEPTTLGVGTEAGIRWFRDVGTIPSRDRRTIELATRTDGTWEGNSSGGVYRLTVMDQTTIRPTNWSLTIRAPEGTDIVWTNEEMEVDGDIATWEGAIDRRLELEVRFSAPVPLRWWRNVLRPFGGL